MPTLLPRGPDRVSADGTPDRLGRAETIAVAVAFVMCAVIVVATVGDASFALHNDGPQHAFAAEVHARYQELTLGWQQIYQLNWPTSARGALEIHLLARALGAGSGLAHTIVLDLALLLWVGAFFCLVLVLSPRRWPVALLGLGTAFQLSFELGVLPFFLGLSGALIVIAVELRAQRSSFARDALLLVALLVVARVHVHPVALAGVFVVMIRAVGPRPVRDVVAAAVAGLPALVVAAVTANKLVGDAADGVALGFSSDGLVSWARDLLPGAPWRGAVTLVLALLSFALVVRERRARQRTDAALAGVAALLLVVAVFVPEDILDWQLARPRLLPLSFAALLALLPVERLGGRTRALAAIAFLLFGLDGALASRRDQARWRRIFQPVVEGLRLAPPQARSWAAIVTAVDEEVPPARLTPWLHVAQLAAIELGGRPAYMQDDKPAKHAIIARTPNQSLVSPPFPGLWAKAWAADRDGQRHFEVVRALAAWGVAVDGLVVYGRPDDRAALEAGGQDVAFARDLDFDRVVYSTTSVGCAIDIELSGPAEPVVVGVGFTPGAIALDVAVVNGAAGVARFTGAPCGAIWIEIDDGVCAGADQIGRLRALADRDQQPVVVRCDRPFPDNAPP